MQREFDRVRLGVGMNPRAERWLEEADEFGFIMISIGMFNTSSLRCPDVDNSHWIIQ